MRIQFWCHLLIPELSQATESLCLWPPTPLFCCCCSYLFSVFITPHCHYLFAGICTLNSLRIPLARNHVLLGFGSLCLAEGLTHLDACWTNHEKWILFNAVSVSFCCITCHPKTSWLETCLISSWLLGWAILDWLDLADLCPVGSHIHGQLMGQLEVRWSKTALLTCLAVGGLLAGVMGMIRPYVSHHTSG